MPSGTRVVNQASPLLQKTRRSKSNGAGLLFKELTLGVAQCTHGLIVNNPSNYSPGSVVIKFHPSESGESWFPLQSLASTGADTCADYLLGVGLAEWSQAGLRLDDQLLVHCVPPG